MKVVTLNLDGTPRQVRRDLWRVWLQHRPPEPEVQVQMQADSAARLDWGELSKLKELVELHYTGTDAGVLEYLASRPSIRTFEWCGHGQSSINLSRLALRQVWLSLPEGDLELALPAGGTLRELSIAAPSVGQRVQVRAVEGGREVAVRYLCRGMKGAPGGMSGLESIRALELWSVDTVRLENLVVFPRLEQLTVYGPPGTIEDLENLAHFRRLRSLRLQECFFFDAQAMPEPSQLPRLEKVEIDGIREGDAVVVSERLSGGPKVVIRGRRSDAWLRANITNPFRQWEDEYPKAIASGAMRAYREAMTAISKLPPDATTDDASDIMLDLMAAFNRLNRKYDLDTIMREEVQSAFDELIDQMPATVDRGMAWTWFDDGREF